MMTRLEYQHKHKMTSTPADAQEASIANIHKAIADDTSLVLFNTIANAGGNTDILIRRLGLTRKQYYSRISALLKAGLISRKNSQYHLTSFGRIVYDAQLMIGRAANTIWKLKAIDSLEEEHKLPVDERNKIINTLIDNQDIIKILVKQS
jgi:predicted transcriptional regulator